MIFPREVFVQQLRVGSILYFLNPDFVSDDPHFHVCMAEAHGSLYLTCCTKQYEKRRRFIESRGLPFSTLVRLVPSGINEFTLETFVDCDRIFRYTHDDLYAIYKTGGLRIRGEVSEAQHEEIQTGLLESPLIEEEVKAVLR
ncbi:MAG: hypothetical protein IPP83_03780 [Flavobacteriales bacterium]|nr:hypothetical protein [Flavobacteriales bacterium]